MMKSPEVGLGVEARWMIRKDYPAVLAMEQAGYKQDAWDEQDLSHILRQHDCIGVVAELDGKVVGYVLYRLRKESIRILRLGIATKFRRRGIARQLMAGLIKKLRMSKRTSISILVRESNLDGQLFLRNVGMKAVKVKRGFYENGEDAYRMAYKLEGAQLP